MTMSIQIKNTSHSPHYHGLVQTVDKLQDGTEAVTTVKQIAPGESVEVTMWDSRSVKITEAQS